MKYSVSSLALAALVMGAVPLAAQDRPVASLTPYVGLLASGNIASGPFGTGVGNRSAPLYGAQLGINLHRNISIVGNFGYSDTELVAGMPLIGGVNVADSKVMMYDGGLQLRFPTVTNRGTGFVPFVEGGVGAIRNEITSGLVNTTSTNVAFVAGGGLDMQLNRDLGIRLMAKDHISRFDFGEAIGFNATGNRAHNWVVGVGLNLGW